MAGLRVEVRGGEIVVTLPGTSYRAVYHKPTDKPGLVATSRSGRWQQGTPMTQAEFHARAWRAANIKARELVDRLAKPSKGDANCGRRGIRRKNDEPKRGSP